MDNLKIVLDACDVFISGEFVEYGSLDFYPTCGLHSLVIKKMNFDCEEKYSILIPAADWDYIQGLGLKSGDIISVPVKIDFGFDCDQPIIWLSDRCAVVRK